MLSRFTSFRVIGWVYVRGLGGRAQPRSSAQGFTVCALFVTGAYDGVHRERVAQHGLDIVRRLDLVNGEAVKTKAANLPSARTASQTSSTGHACQPLTTAASLCAAGPVDLVAVVRVKGLPRPGWRLQDIVRQVQTLQAVGEEVEVMLVLHNKGLGSDVPSAASHRNAAV